MYFNIKFDIDLESLSELFITKETKFSIALKYLNYHCTYI